MRPALIALTLALTAGTAAAAETAANPQIEVDTSMGTIVLELDAAEAPQTVAHFVELVDAGFFDGLIFHRVIADFMIQAGGYTESFERREDEFNIPNESRNNLSNLRGTIAMARTSDPHSANSQFFINVVDNTRLDFGGSVNTLRWGYTVFGKVIEGMDVVDAISLVETAPQAGMADAPVEAVVIRAMRRVGAGD